ncbi:MAG: BatD family protein [Bacteroidales bacterium]
MFQIRKIIIALLLLFTVQFAWAQHSFMVDAPRVVGQDEVFRVVFTADGEMSDFISPTFAGLDILAGPSPSRMSSTQIINGKRTDAVEMSYTFIVRPSKVGLARISQASASINGKTYTTKGLDVEVVDNAGGSQGKQSSKGVSQGTSNARNNQNLDVSNDDIFLRLSFSKNRVVKGEPIIATLKLYTRLPIAGFEDIKFPVFNGFWSQEIETPQNINFVRENVGNQIYSSAVLRKYMLLPQQSGEITIDPAEMICQVQIQAAGGGGRSIFDDFFDSGTQTVKKRVSSKKAKISVAQLPGNAPSTFGGGVGKFNMNVKLSRNDIKTHEAASIMVDISGSGNINLIEAPKIEFPADFEKYDLKTDNNFTNGAGGTSGKKNFEFPFIPRSEGRFVIPPIEYAYYDIAAGKYITLRSDSIVLNVGKGENIAQGQILQGVNKQAVANLGEDIRYIITGGPHLAKKGSFFVGGVLFFIIIAVIVLLYSVVYYYLKSRAKLRGDIKRTRNKKANKVAKIRLKQAQNYLKENLYSPFYEELHKALLGYISDKLSIQFADMQRDTIKETLEQKNVSSEIINNFIQLLNDCEMARYSQAGGAGEMDVQYNKAIEIISDFENTL